jgi:hypothetical protein
LGARFPEVKIGNNADALGQSPYAFDLLHEHPAVASLGSEETSFDWRQQLRFCFATQPFDRLLLVKSIGACCNALHRE